MQNILRYPEIPTLNSGTETFFEFPLYPQVKTYLRLEYLLKRLEKNETLANESECELYFQSLFGICDLLNHIHVRSDLVKDLAKQRDRLKIWEANPDIDRQYLDNLYTESFVFQQELLQAPRLAQHLRDDPFLVSFSQRYDVPAGACSFDAPHLHLWLSMPKEHLHERTKLWRESLKSFSQALNFWLNLTRQQGEMKETIVKQGVFHQDVPDVNLIQIKLDAKYHVYPLVNNYKARFSLRLLPFNEQGQVADEIPLSIAAH